MGADVALSEFEYKRAQKLVGEFVERRRPPAHIRAKLDFAFRIEGQSVVLFGVRPRWRGAPGETMEEPHAKATYVRSQGLWRVYWMRADLKWHAYPPCPETRDLESFLRLVDEDAHHCFFG